MGLAKQLIIERDEYVQHGEKEKWIASHLSDKNNFDEEERDRLSLKFNELYEQQHLEIYSDRDFKEREKEILSETVAEKIIVDNLYQQGFPKKTIEIEKKLYDTSSRADIVILYNNEIIAVIEVKKSYHTKYEKRFFEQLNSYHLTITKNQNTIPRLFLVFYDTSTEIFHEYNLEKQKITPLSSFPTYQELVSKYELKNQTTFDNSNIQRWDDFVNTIDINKLNKIEKGVTDSNFKEGERVREFLKQLGPILQRDLPLLKNYEYKLNSASTQPYWSNDNGFRISFIGENESLLETNQINITLWSNWGGAVFIKDNKRLCFDNPELKYAIPQKYNVKLNENNLHITALSFNTTFPSYQEILLALKTLIEIMNELNTKNQQVNNQKHPSQLNSFASFHNDIPAQDDIDSLSISKDVDAFAKLITYKGLSTPLAIGLFGKWGSGKSFFMNQLSARVDYYSEHSDKDVFCQDIVHVKFNAWHYSDTNLWASLVYTIFDEINNTINHTTSKDQAEAKKSSLYKELKSSKLAIEKKEQEEHEIENKISALNQEFLEHEETLKKTEKKSKELNLADIKQIILDDPEIQKDIKEIQRDLKDNNNFDFESIQTMYTELQTIIGTFKQLVHLIKNDKRFRYSFIIVASSLMVSSYFIHHFYEQKLLTTAVPVVGSMIFYMQSKLKNINPYIKKINDFIENYKRIEKNKKSELYDTKLENEHKIKELNNELDKIKETKKLFDKKKLNIEKEIQDIKDGKYFKNFILNRVTSNDYSKHLGLISLIRDDFTELENFLLSDENNKTYNIDRIILYIDDLDRCPDNLVINVLEAIHLLLAFKLFVVIAGVDSRWIQGSLRNQYSNFSNNNSDITPKQYLEKIFQIPFQIKNLDNEDKQNFVKDILRDNVIDLYESKIHPENINMQESGIYKNLLYQEPTDEFIQHVDNLVNELEKSTPNIHKELKFMPEEIQYIEKLSSYFGDTPRMIKRFINIYRIIRSHEDIVNIIDNRFNHYKLVLLLLTQNILKEQTTELKNFKNEFKNELSSFKNFNTQNKQKIETFIQRFDFNTSEHTLEF